MVCPAGFRITAWFALGTGTMACDVESTKLAWLVLGNLDCGVLFVTGTMASFFNFCLYLCFYKNSFNSLWKS